MASRPELFLPVEAQGELRLDAPTGRTLKVIADGNQLRAEIPGWQELEAATPRDRGRRRQSLRVAARALAACGLTLSLESGGQTLARLGHGVTANWLARLLGLAPAAVHLPAIALRFRG